jgi:hypothetical protein
MASSIGMAGLVGYVFSWLFFPFFPPYMYGFAASDICLGSPLMI